MATAVRPEQNPFADLAAKPPGPNPFADLAPKRNSGDITIGAHTGEHTPGAAPSLLDQAKSFGKDVIGGITHLATHPWELLTTPVSETGKAVFTPVEGETISAARANRGKGGNLMGAADIGEGKQLPEGATITKANTPDAITPAEQAAAGRQAAMDIGLLASGGSGKATAALLAGSGASHNPEHPIKGAAEALAMGGLVHGAIKGTGASVAAARNATDVSGGMIEAATTDPALRAELAEPPSAARDGLPPRPETTAGKALARAETIANRPNPFADLAEPTETKGIPFTDKRAASAIPSEIIPPEMATARPSQLVAPETQTPSGPIVPPVAPAAPPAPILDRFGVPVQGEAGQVPTGPYDAKGIRRIPAAELPVNQRPPIEPAPDAQTVSAGGRIIRRPGIVPPPLLPVESRPAPVPPAEPLPAVEPKTDATTYTTPEPLLKPVVSSNGTFEARPGVLKAANAELGSTGTSPTRFTATFPEDIETPAKAPELPSSPRDVPAQELVNKATLDTDPNGSKALAQELDRLKEQGLDKRTVSFETQRQTAKDFADTLNIDRLTLDPSKYGKLSGAEIVGLKNVLTENLNMMGELSKQMAEPDLSVGESELLSDKLDKLRDQNDALLSKIVKETSEKGRDLGFLRQLSNGTLDPDAWVITAKRLAGDSILDDTKIAKIRQLAKDAADACGAG